MRYFLLLHSFIFLFSSCDSINKLINNTVKNANSTKSESKGKFTGLREQHYSSGKIRSAVNYIKGVKNGSAKNFYENGKVKLEMNYEDGKRNGKSFYYYENGDLYRESNYKNDKLYGIRKVYSGDKLKSETPYKNGEPGKGLKEYLLNGKLKTKYPKILVKPIDKRLTQGTYILDIYFSDSNIKDEFYFGKLKDGIFVHSKMESITVNRGHGKFTAHIPPGNFIMKKLDIVGVHITKQGNPYVTTRTYNLSIE